MIFSLLDIQFGGVIAGHLFYFNNGIEGSALIAASYGRDMVGNYFITWDLLYLSFIKNQIKKLFKNEM